MDEIDRQRIYDAFEIPAELRPELDALTDLSRKRNALRREEEAAFVRRLAAMVSEFMVERGIQKS